MASKENNTFQLKLWRTFCGFFTDMVYKTHQFRYIGRSINPFKQNNNDYY